MPEFLETVTSERAREMLERFSPVAGEDRVPLAAALGRVVASNIATGEPAPAFDRSVMDGYAVRSADTFGASESTPAYLRLSGRIAMGAAPGPALGAGEAREISTGGAMPEGADAVVMVEYTREVGDGQVEVTRAVAPWANVLRRGEDLPADAVIVRRGRRLGPADLLALAAFGTSEIAVFRRPTVGVLSTGDELVPVDTRPGLGQVRDGNSAALCGQVREAGGEPVLHGICPDDPAELRSQVRRMLDSSDLVLVSGGSSAGARDSTAQVLEALGPPGILAHGISVAPGKPTILAASGTKPVLGLPGHPVSSMVIFRLFVNPLVRLLGGEAPPREPFPSRTRARMARRVASKPGREDFVRVTLEGGLAHPLLGGSGAFSTILRAQGLVRIERDREGLAQDEEVEVLLF